MAEETERTAQIGLQSLTDMIPFIESSVERFRADVQADEDRRRLAPRGAE
jgi:hypothetical protein